MNELKQSLHGESNLGPTITNNIKTTKFVFSPTIYQMKISRFMTEKWMTVFETDYSVWKRLKGITMYNTALGTIDYPLFERNAYRFTLLNRYQFNDKWAGFTSLEYESSDIDGGAKHNYTSYPTSAGPGITVGGEYQFTDWGKLTVFANDTFSWNRFKTKFPATTDVTNSVAYYSIGALLTLTWD
jgi:long-subunit fatty acid transport protein